MGKNHIRQLKYLTVEHGHIYIHIVPHTEVISHSFGKFLWAEYIK
nr:MAG TPA: hypothetical protein [Caudoviricetes sp.]